MISQEFVIHGPPQQWTVYVKDKGPPSPGFLRMQAWHLLNRPDVTNYRKSCEDACNGVLFVDDSQVVGGKIKKRYAPQYSEGYTVIKIREVDVWQ